MIGDLIDTIIAEDLEIEDTSNVSESKIWFSHKVKDKIVSIKLNEVAVQLDLIKEEDKIKDKHMLSVLRAYDLIKETFNVIK